MSVARLIFIPFPVISHLVAAMKAAKILADRDQRLSITILVMNFPTDTKISSYINNSPQDHSSRITFLHLPQLHDSILDDLIKSPIDFMVRFVQTQKGPVRDAVSRISDASRPCRLAGFVVDLFCTAMMDVAHEFRVPSYIFFTCSASTLGLMLHIQTLMEDHNLDPAEHEDSDFSVSVPTHVNPVPARVWPDLVFSQEIGFLNLMRKFREAKGIIVNTFLELEPGAIKSLSEDETIPPVYPVGPMIHGETEQDKTDKNEGIIRWLDEQPDSSVVFLCFGSNGSFNPDQAQEIAKALERSGNRFLWALRKPPPEGKRELPGEYEDPSEVLPSGFLERTAGLGRVIGWAPQMAVLSHPAVGGFVSHCGWNSTLESVQCGVPMAVWPLFAEQQANAFLLVKEFEMGVDIKLDYKKSSGVTVESDVIERAIGRLMDPENAARVKVNVLKEKSSMALVKGGSSDTFLDRLIVDFINNIS